MHRPSVTRLVHSPSFEGLPVTSIRRYFTRGLPVAGAMRVVSLGHLMIALVRFFFWLHRLNQLSRRWCVVQLLPLAHACLCRLAIHWEIDLLRSFVASLDLLALSLLVLLRWLKV